jgi:hypothetical protein
LVDFTDAIKERIGSMSADELVATETRRLSREADQGNLTGIESLWEPAAGSSIPPATKTVTVRVDTAPNGSHDILRVSHDSGFHESVILTATNLRALAGGDSPGPAPDRFIVKPSTPSQGAVSVDLATLAEIIGRARPLEMARVRRMLAAERIDPAQNRLPVEARIQHFAARWQAEAIALRINKAIATVSSRAILLLAGRDHVALWVRKEDLAVGPGRLLGSALAPAIVRSGGIETKAVGSVDHYIENSYGSGPERSLVLDVARLRKVIGALAQDSERDAAFAILDHLIKRSGAIRRERATRGKPAVLRMYAAQT